MTPEQREAADNWLRFTCTEHEFMQQIQWLYWMEVPAEDGSWEYRNTTIDKGYPVTVMDKAELERLCVDVCRACMKACPPPCASSVRKRAIGEPG